MKMSLTVFILSALLVICAPAVGFAAGADGSEEFESAGPSVVILSGVIGGAGLCAAVMVIEIKKHRPVKAATDADAYIVGGSVRITSSEDTFIRTNTRTVKLQQKDKK